MARAFRSVRADPLTFLGRGVRSTTATLVAFPVPGAPALLLNDPADVRHVLQTSARNWGKQTVQYAALARVTGPGLLASAEPSWIDHRRLAAPAFHHQRLEAVGDQVRAAAAPPSRRLGGPHAAAVADGAVVDVAALTHTHRPGRGRPSALQHRPLRPGPAPAGGHERGRRAGGAARPLDPAHAPSGPRPGPTSGCARPAAAWTPAPPRSSPSGGPATPAPAARPATATTSSACCWTAAWTDGEIRDELVTMVIAGHETVAAALAWTLMLLAEHPPAQDRVRAELDAHPGPVPLLGHRERLPWTRAVVDEALRLYPPAWALSRRSHRDDVIGGRAGPGRHAGHHQPLAGPPAPRPRGPSPQAFRPERFLDAGTAPHGLPAVRAGTATVHRPGVRAGRDGRRAAPTAARAPHRRAGRPRRLDPPGGAGPGRGAPARRHAARRHAGRARRDDCPRRRLALVLLAAAGGGARARLVADLRTIPPADAVDRGATVSVSVVVPARDEEPTLPTLLRSVAEQLPEVRRGRRGGRRLAGRDRRGGTRGRRPRRAGRHAPARLDRQGLGLPHRRRGDARATCCCSSTPTPCSRPDALDGLLAAARPARRAGVGAAASTTSYARTSSCRPTSTWSSLLASAAFTRRGRRREPRPMAFGPCLLTSREDYERAGGHAAVRAEILDDVALAAAYHRAGLPVRCAVGGESVRMRSYPGGLRQLVAGWTKNFASGAAAAAPSATAAAVAWVSAHHAVAVGAVLSLLGRADRTGRVAGRRAPPAVGGGVGRRGAWQLRWVLRRDRLVPLVDVGAVPRAPARLRPRLRALAALTVVRRSVRWRGRDVSLAGGRSGGGGGLMLRLVMPQTAHDRRGRRRLGRLPRRHGLRRPPAGRRAAVAATAGCCGSGASRTGGRWYRRRLRIHRWKDRCPRRATCSRRRQQARSCPRTTPPGLAAVRPRDAPGRAGPLVGDVLRPALRPVEPAAGRRPARRPTACW